MTTHKSKSRRKSAIFVLSRPRFRGREIQGVSRMKSTYRETEINHSGNAKWQYYYGYLNSQAEGSPSRAPCGKEKNEKEGSPMASESSSPARVDSEDAQRAPAENTRFSETPRQSGGPTSNIRVPYCTYYVSFKLN